MTTNPRIFVLLALCIGGCVTRHAQVAPPPTLQSKPAPAEAAIFREDESAARHALDRFAFGPTPGQAARIAHQGVEKWFLLQLEPAKGPDPALEAALTPYRGALEPPLALIERFGDPDQMDAEAPERPFRDQLKGVDFPAVLGSIAMAELTRHVESDRQVEEVMVDFWTNHFNIFARKGLVRLFAGDYVERALRPHALGRFQDLLIATARHPAMLVYLDNARSVAASSKKKRGLNENYARELLELHTLGVDGGYTQKDVTDVARVLTGWSVQRPKEGGVDFVFRERAHDRGEKQVLGTEFPANHGEDEGMKLLTLLAEHPSTARHLSKKLCMRFVADDPPADCVDAASTAYLASHGNIARVLSAIFQSNSFWDPKNRNQKLKAPVELVASALRAVDAKPDGSLALTRTLAGLGEPLLLEQVPTGYPETESEWIGGSSILARMNFATALASEKLPGAELDLDRVLPTTLPARELESRALNLFVGDHPSPDTVNAIHDGIAGLDDARARRTAVVALLVGSPDFQRQ